MNASVTAAKRILDLFSFQPGTTSRERADSAIAYLQDTMGSYHQQLDRIANIINRAFDYSKASRLPDDYKPEPLEQRPPVEIVAPVLHNALDSAISHGYVTGSVGASWTVEDSNYIIGVSYQITRKK